jgi:hypothetical protein
MDSNRIKKPHPTLAAVVAAHTGKSMEANFLISLRVPFCVRDRKLAGK